MTDIDRFLDPAGPPALVVREWLVPVEGADGVVFPPTYAASPDGLFKGGYNIDQLALGKNVCAIDSVGSQANRLEVLFLREPYARLVPRIVVHAGPKSVNLLEAGHRAGDAIVRCTALKDELHAAFLAADAGDSEPLGKIAPTSLVFGVWDSRDTQVKRPRLLTSTVRAFDVLPLTRSAQYVPAVDYVAQGLLEEPQDRQTRDAYAKRGFVHVPSSGVPGGVIASAGIRRDAVLHLAALRLLRAGDDVRTRRLQRYVLGLSLLVLTYPADGYYRQGCNLVPDPNAAPEFRIVERNGRRVEANLAHDEVLAYATAAAKEFGVGPDRTVEFSPELAGQDVAGDGKAAGKPKKVSTRTK